MMLGNPASLVAAISAAPNSFSSSLLIPNRTPITQQNPLFCRMPTPYFSLFFFNNDVSLCSLHHEHTRFTSSFLSRPKCTNAFSVHAVKKKRTEVSPVTGMSEFDDEEEDDDDVFDGLDEDGAGGDDDGGEDVVLPLSEMKEWLKKKPRGFGVDRLYDTSLEDKLLEEIEKSRQTQIVNAKKLESNPVTPTQKKGQENKKASEAVASGIKVRVTNLPKKMNIHRDLKTAFKDVKGIVNIVPAVTGNKKTRDPVCKGVAFVYFRSEEDAARFIQLFSMQNVAFGKIQKQIICEMIKSKSSNALSSKSRGGLSSDQHPVAPALQADLSSDLEMDDSFGEETASNISDGSDIENATNSEDVMENMDTLCMSGLKEPKKEKTTRSSIKKQNKNQASKKKTIIKEHKVSKLNVPGSAKRLKVKEKAVLTDVFSKYGTALATNEER